MRTVNPVRIERSRDAPKDSAIPMGVSTSLDTNGKGELSMGFPFAIVGFDLDGTLLDTLGDLAAAVNHPLALMERAPLAEAAVRTMIGRGARHMPEAGQTGRTSRRETGFQYV